MATDKLDTPDIDGAGIYRPVRQVAAHLRQIAASVGTPVGGVTAREIGADVDCAHTAVVVRGIENSPRLVDREVVRARSVEMVERDLVRRSEVADVDNVDVSTRRGADRAWPLFTHECKTLLAADCILNPPDVVGFSARGDDTSNDGRIRDAPSQTAAPNVPDRDSRIPQRGDQNSIAHENIVNVRASHSRRENLLWRGRVGEIDNH